MVAAWASLSIPHERSVTNVVHANPALADHTLTPRNGTATAKTRDALPAATARTPSSLRNNTWVASSAKVAPIVNEAPTGRLTR